MASAFGSCRPTSGWPSSSALCCTQPGAAVRRSPMPMSSRSARRAMPPWWCPPTQTTSPRSRPAYPAYGSSSDGRPISERCADSDIAGPEMPNQRRRVRCACTRRHHRAPLYEGRFPRTFDEPRGAVQQLRWKHQSEGSGYDRRRRPVTSSARGWEVPGGSPTLDGDVLRAPYVRSGRGEGDVHDRLQRTAGRGSGRRLDLSERDDQVRSASLLDAATYPNITFTSDGLREQGAGWLLDGALTAHGQTVPVEVVIDSATNEGDGVRVHAYVEHLDRYAFGVTKVKGFAGRYLDLDLDVFAGPA